jgi:[ribosomal protein S5]-alanine N-acetyltransferase
MMMIETERLLLKLLEPVRAQDVVSYKEKNRSHFSPWSPLYPEEYYKVAYWSEQLEKNIKDFEEDRSLMMFILMKGSLKIIGDCSLTQISRGYFQACYLGYGLDEEHCGRGFMTEALGGLLKYAFEEMHLHRVMANYVPHNLRSGKLLRRLNFIVEGYARDYLLIAGRWQDFILTSLTQRQPFSQSTSV